jgi:hypothetical protein
MQIAKCEVSGEHGVANGGASRQLARSIEQAGSLFHMI